MSRFFSILKDYVGNKSHLEGSIAEGYIAEEAIFFCSKYLEGSHTDNTKKSVVNENKVHYKFSSGGISLGKVTPYILEEKSSVQAHRYVLCHCDKITSYRETFIDEEKRRRRRHTHLTPSEIEKIINEHFANWFKQQVNTQTIILYFSQVFCNH